MKVDAEEFVANEAQGIDQADYDQVNALNLFYDMAVPTMIGLKGDYLMRKDLIHLYKANFVTAANSKICLGIIQLQLNGMCRGDIRADATALGEAKKYAPLINTITAPTTTLCKRVEAMMAWAMEDPAQHAVLIYKIYDQLFAQCKMQSVPSLRLGIPYYLIERHGADEALRLWRNTSVTARNHPSGFERYRYFLEAIWLPYAASHEPADRPDSSAQPHTRPSTRSGESPGSVGTHDTICSSSMVNLRRSPTWWTRPCSYSADTGSARTRLPREAITFSYGTSGSTVASSDPM